MWTSLDSKYGGAITTKPMQYNRVYRPRVYNVSEMRIYDAIQWKITRWKFTEAFCKKPYAWILPPVFFRIAKKRLNVSKWNLLYLILPQFHITSGQIVEIRRLVFEKVAILWRHYTPFLGWNSRVFNKIVQIWFLSKTRTNMGLM